MYHDVVGPRLVFCAKYYGNVLVLRPPFWNDSHPGREADGATRQIAPTSQSQHTGRTLEVNQKTNK